MNNEIKAAVKSIKKILCDDEFFYQIPDYQRPYSWDKDNLSDLIEDLTDAYNNSSDENYFCGSLVVVENQKEDRYDVIDGQQRLTTFTILFCVFRDFFEEKLSIKSKDFINLSIQDKYEKGKEKLKFLTSETSQNSFQQTVIKGITEIKIDDNKYLKNAYLLKGFINERLNEERINDVNKFAEWIFEKVVLTQIICPNQDTAIQIFNVLNDRGMPLSSVDILKSTLMQKLSDEDRKIFKANWEKVKVKLKAEELSFDNLFNIYLYYLKATNPKTTLHKELLNTFKSEDSLQLIHKLENFADSYIEVRQLDNKYFYCLKYLRHSIYWESILTTAKYRGYESFDELLKLLVAYYYQNWIIGATVARIKQPSFNVLKSLKKNDSIQVIEKILTENLDKYGTTNEYKKVLNGSYVYGLKWTKPVLLILEYFTKDSSNQSFISLDKKIEVEHILPITIDERYGWQNIFTEEERKLCTNTLGNLTLLSKRKNIQAKNYSFLMKKEAYGTKDNLITSLKLTSDISKNEKWTKIEIEKRQKSLIITLNKVLLINDFKNDKTLVDVVNLQTSIEDYRLNKTEVNKKNIERLKKAELIETIGETAFKYNGFEYKIKRVVDRTILLYENENLYLNSLRPFFHKLVNELELNVDLYYPNSDELKNTRDLGRDIINYINNLDNINVSLESKNKISKRDYTKYIINNNSIKLPKNRFVLEFIREFLKQNQISFYDLKLIFPDELQGSIGVINKLEFVQTKYNHTKDKRHFVKANEVLISSDNVEFVVCTEWSLENIQHILKIARIKGFEIEEIKKNSI